MWDKLKNKNSAKEEQPIEEFGQFTPPPSGAGRRAQYGTPPPYVSDARQGVYSPDLPGPQTIRPGARDAIGAKHIPLFAEKEEYSISRLYPWQKNIVNELQRNDLYIIAPPGGGKTTPVKTYWVRNLLFNLDLNDEFIKAIYRNGTPIIEAIKTGNRPIIDSVVTFSRVVQSLILKPESVKKIVFAVPTKTLALELYNDFVSFFVDLLLFASYLYDENRELLNSSGNPSGVTAQRTMFSSGAVSGVIRNMLNGLRNTNDPRAREREIKNLAQSLVCMRVGGGGVPETGNVRKSPVVIMTIEKLKHEIAPSWSKNIGLIIFDEAHLYQPTSNDPDKAQDAAYKQAGLLLDVFDKIYNKTRIVFLSGTIGENSARNLTEYMGRLYNRKNMKVFPAKQAVNTTEIKIVPNDSLMDIKKVSDIIIDAVNKNDWGTAVILFSKYQIDALVNMCMSKLARKSFSKTGPTGFGEHSPSSFGGGPISKRSDVYTRGQKAQRLEDMETREDIIKRIMKIPGADGIQNADLREAVAYGIGYIYREEGPNIRPGKTQLLDSDKLIVARLFSEKKIPVLISTSAIGIGVNVKIRRMYVPSLNITTGNAGRVERSEIAFRDLSQLLNRTGRGVSDIGVVYTPEHNIETVSKAIGASLESFEDANKPIVAIKSRKPSKHLFKTFLGSLMRRG